MEKEKAGIFNQSIKRFKFWAFKTAKIKAFNKIESVKNESINNLNLV